MHDGRQEVTKALDKTLKEFRDNQTIFGGDVIQKSGDFCLTLPVIPRSTAIEELNVRLQSSKLWRYVTILRLTNNMRDF